LDHQRRAIISGEEAALLDLRLTQGAGPPRRRHEGGALLSPGPRRGEVAAPLEERLASKELHRVVGQAAVHTLAEDPDDARVAEPRQRLDLPPDTAEQGLLWELHHLEGDDLAG